jgi:hypothetical protein
MEEAVNSLRWMIFEMTTAEEELLRRHLSKCLVRENGHWKLPYRRVVRWAVLWWEKACDQPEER